MAPGQAEVLVEARLGRFPQDVLEAAVALEAWGGVRAAAALRQGAELIAVYRGRQGGSGDKADEKSPSDEGLRGEAIAVLTTVLAVAAWTAPLARALGASAVEAALRLALPSTLALQWALHRRYLGRRDGLGRLARDRAVIWLIPPTVVGVPFLALGVPGALGGLLVATWVGGAILARRGWSLWYGILVVLVAIGLDANLPALGLAAAAAAVTLTAVWLALASSESASHSPAPWRRAASAGLIGAGLGALLVVDASVGWGIRGALPALALIPATAGSLWGSHHLSQLRSAVPRALQGTSVFDAERGSFAGPAMLVFLGAVLRFVGSAGALSLAVVLAARWTGMTPRPPTSLFLGFACLALVTLTVSLLESFGSARLAVLAVASGLVAEVALDLSTTVPMPGAGLAFGGTIGVLVALPPTLALLRRPGRFLATTLWID